MKADEIIGNLSKYKRQARQLCPNACVISIERAEKAIRHAYNEGFNQGKKINKE